jgi:ATP-binding cassette, subfamily B, bacterial
MLALQVATVVGVAAAALVTRALLGDLLEADRGDGDLGGLVPELIALAGLGAALAIANAVQIHSQRILTEQCVRHGEDRVLAVTASVPLAEFDRPKFHDAVERAVVAVRRLPAVIAGLGGVLRGAAGIGGALVALAVIVPVFAPAVLLVAAPLWFAARRRARVFHRFARALTREDRERDYVARLLSDRDPAKEVRAFGLIPFLEARRGRLWDRRLAELRRVAGRQLALGAASALAASLIVGGALLALVAMTLSNDVSVADATTAMGTLALLGQRVGGTAASTATLTESALFIEDYLALLESVPAASALPPPHGAPRGPVEAVVDDVTFAYPGTRAPAVRAVSLEIAAGEVVALVGENGSGKTTLAKLLAGLYPPDAGRVIVGGRDTATADGPELRGSVALIFQDFVRYALPARENVGMGRPERAHDDDAILRAASVAGADAFLERLPDGYDTVLGPAFAGGTDLSLGQWQRVALARAIFRDAPFVILDEPTSALDARAEADLFERIRDLFAGRAVLLISHRFSTVRSADRIHVMHAGRIVETGTHDELIAAGGRYADLFGLQAAPYR